jgi:predicted HNH restriction endonuclease
MAERTKNPTWSRDELILAMSAYMELRGHLPSGPADPSVVALSRQLNELEKPADVADLGRFRNPNGAYMKLMNFRSFDPDYTSQGKSGLSNTGKLDKQIWDEFFERPVELGREVQRIGSGQADARKAVWIFQGNPNSFNVNEYLEERFALGSRINWVVRQHRSRVKCGDVVYIWRSAGRLKGESGVVARGIIVDEPAVLPDDSSGLWVDGSPNDEFRAVLSLEDVRLGSEEGMISVDAFLSDMTLSQVRILKMRSETNYALTTEQAARLDLFWGRSAPQGATEEIIEGFREGDLLERIHRRRERNGRLVELAKARFVELHGKLMCEACGFNAQTVYGLDENALIEAHHKVPISDLKAGALSKVEDLVMLCPNCHRAAHHGKQVLDVDALRLKLGNGAPGTGDQ